MNVSKSKGPAIPGKSVPPVTKVPEGKSGPTPAGKISPPKPASKAPAPIGVEVKAPDASTKVGVSKPLPAGDNSPLDLNNPPRLGTGPVPKPTKLPTAEELAAADAKATKKADAAKKKAEKEAADTAKKAEKAEKAEKADAAKKKAEKEARKAAKAAGEKVALGASGRKSKFSGLTFHTVKSTNTRRFGTHGYRALQIIFNNPGVSFDEYMKLGGGLNHIDWDLTHGNLVAKKADGSIANVYAKAPAAPEKAAETPAPAAPTSSETPAQPPEAEPIAA